MIKEKQYQYNLIRKAAWGMYFQYPWISFEDLMSEAILAYTYALQDYVGDRVLFTTFAYHCMINALRSFVERERRNHHTKEMPDKGYTSTPVFEVLDIMSSNAAKVCERILRSPTKYATMQPKAAKGLLRQELRSEGWAWEDIQSSFREIKTILNET